MHQFGRKRLACFTILFLFPIHVRADDRDGQDKARSKAPPTPSVAQVAETAKQSIAVITFTGRDGKRRGMGTGFVVSADGLIATNLHVIGEARPVSVQLADGKRYDVTSVHASDRTQDLALLRIKAANLSPLALGNSDQLEDGAAVVGLGNPLGLTHSIVAGVVSARRSIEGRPMLQIAIPIESGNSGGPLLDMAGRVQGIVTMKSAVTENLGFAIPINALKPLLAKPNPISMQRWLTQDALDAKEWTPLFDASWRQRGGKIIVDGAGTGFGGRSLCLADKPAPERPFEISVAVRLDDEAGAAGLVFHADGGDKHYGFYPSGGQLRLTRFDGPDVFSWNILKNQPSPAYRPGEWNTLRVRVEKDRFLCYVNGQLCVESADSGLVQGKVGLAKFRDTRAEFKGFQIGKHIASDGKLPDLLGKIDKALASQAPGVAPRTETFETILGDSSAGLGLLRDKAKQLEQQARQLRETALAIHHKRIQAELQKMLQQEEDKLDLLKLSLLVARLDNEEVDIEPYVGVIERLARQAAGPLARNATDQAKLARLNEFFFNETGFHGSRGEYYTRANSYLNDVLDDREGLPITLAIVYMELARRLGLRVEGVGLPGHFVVRYLPAKGEPQIIDIFEGGKVLSIDEARQKAFDITGRAIREEHFAAVSKKAIVLRLLHNLIGVARGEGDLKSTLRYLDTILLLSPEEVEDRMMRAAVRYQLANQKGALEDVDWLLEKHPAGMNEEKVLELRRLLMR